MSFKKLFKSFKKDETEVDLPRDEDITQYVPPFLNEGKKQDNLSKSILFISLIDPTFDFDSANNQNIKKLQTTYSQLIATVPDDKKDKFMQAIKVIADRVDDVHFNKNANLQMMHNQLNIPDKHLGTIQNSLAAHFKQQYQEQQLEILAKNIEELRNKIDKERFEIKDALGTHQKGIVYKQVWEEIIEKAKNESRQNRILGLDKYDEFGESLEKAFKDKQDIETYPQNMTEIENLREKPFTFVEEKFVPESTSASFFGTPKGENTSSDVTFKLPGDKLTDIKEKFETLYKEKNIQNQLEVLNDKLKNLNELKNSLDAIKTSTELTTIEQKLNAIMNPEPVSAYRWKP